MRQGILGLELERGDTSVGYPWPVFVSDGGMDPYQDASLVPPPPEGRPKEGYAPDHTITPIITPGYRKEPPPAYQPPQPEETVEGWWSRLGSTTHTMIYVGGAFLAGAVLVWLLRPRYKANLRAARSSRLAARGRAPKGRIRTVRAGRRFGHKVPPKRYWKLGARHKEDFAWPEGYKYPLIFHHRSGKVNVERTKRHIRAAKTYFARSKHLYPMAVRWTIASRINKASRRYQAGPTKVKV